MPQTVLDVYDVSDLIYRGAEEYGRRYAEKNSVDADIRHVYAIGYRQNHMATVIAQLVSTDPAERARGEAHARELIELGRECVK